MENVESASKMHSSFYYLIYRAVKIYLKFLPSIVPADSFTFFNIVTRMGGQELNPRMIHRQTFCTLFYTQVRYLITTKGCNVITKA